MAYIGRQQDGFGVRSRFIYTATGGQTTFNTDDSGNALSYSDGAYVDVYLNGVLLDPSDYTATSLTSIVLDSGATASDILEVIVYDVFSVFSGTFTNGITASEATVTGDLTVDTNTLFVDSTNNNVGIGTTSPTGVPTTTLHINGTTNAGIHITDSASGATDSDGVYLSMDNPNLYIQNKEAGFTAFETSGTERMRILSGGGITFNGDSTQANALDDYEEGAWTPTLTGTATALAATYHASYVKIGRKVTAQAYILFASDTDTSPVKITMPFNSHNVSNGWQAGVIGYNTGFTGDHIIIQPNSNVLEIRRGSGGNQRLYSEYSGQYIIFGITYKTA